MFDIMLPSVLINYRAVKFCDNLSKADNILCTLCLFVLSKMSCWPNFVDTDFAEHSRDRDGPVILRV